MNEWKIREGFMGFIFIIFVEFLIFYEKFDIVCCMWEELEVYLVDFVVDE